MEHTSPASAGNNLVDADEIHATLHALVDGLAPDALQALWDVLLVCNEGQLPAVPHDER